MEDSFADHLLLPYFYKKLGYGLLVLALPLGLGAFTIFKSFYPTEDADTSFQEWGISILHYPFSIALGLIIFSREKQEDEMVKNIRYKSFVKGVYYLLIAILLLPVLSNISNLILGREVRMPDLGGMLAVVNLLLFYIYASFKYNLYALNKKLEMHEE